MSPQVIPVVVYECAFV